MGDKFIGNSPSALVLGDNIFYGHDFQQLLGAADQQTQGATVFAYHVKDPERYGVVAFDKEGKADSIVSVRPTHVDDIIEINYMGEAALLDCGACQ